MNKSCETPFNQITIQSLLWCLLVKDFKNMTNDGIRSNTLVEKGNNCDMASYSG